MRFKTKDQIRVVEAERNSTRKIEEHEPERMKKFKLKKDARCFRYAQMRFKTKDRIRVVEAE
ncbi:unnamed protein product [Dovyalis caffra]|uniref:Uncharacterized protein n=1 Tax=Dovyalis caffra TaxID=77055 RepID=A0AAV1QYS3_9ROSI|nr:unnamed protein product [Dovyalis caffra]